MPHKNLLKIPIVLVLVTLASFGCVNLAFAQATDQTALIAQLQKQVQQLLNQIQTLQAEVKELKTETGIQALPVSPISPTSLLTEEEETPPALPDFTRSLSLGARGDDVRKLQEFLARDKEIYPEGLATGFYGPKTVEAVRRWQRKNKLEAVGTVGPKTIAKFRELGGGVVQGLMQQGTPSGVMPPGLMMAPGVQRQMATSTSSGQATTTPIMMPPVVATTTPVIATTTPAIPAVPATPSTPQQSSGQASAVPATPATPATPSTSSGQAGASNELKVTYPNGGETWYKGNAYTITWQNPLAGGFTGKEKYYWNVLLKRGNTAWQADGTVPVTQSSYTWSKWTGWAEPIPNASDFKVGISLVDTCAAQVGGSCPSANISIIPSGGIDYSDGYFTATSTPPATTTTGGTPQAPTNLTVTSSGGRWNLYWTDNAATETVYGVYMRSSGTTNWSWLTTLSANATSYSDVSSTGSYEFKVYACVSFSRFENPDVQSSCSGSNVASVSSTQSSADTTPPTVTLKTGYPNVATQVQPVYVGFDANEEAKVIYEYGLTTSYGSIQTVWDQYWTANGAYLPTLSSGTTYHIRAKATDRAGNIGYSNDYTFTTEGSVNTVPTNASAVTGYVSGTTVNLQWTDNSSNETSFDIYRRSSGLNVTPGAWTRIIQTSSNVTTYSDSPGAGTWEYRTDTCNSAGCASNSGTVQLTVTSSSATTATTTSAVLDSLNELLMKLREFLRR